MTNQTPVDRPLITLALFAYNQEKFIREAIEGTFSQTYEPLEIILSDDCSSDLTFEIMQEMAAAYEGPHHILLRRSEINLGTALHFSAVGKMSSGKLIVVAAGDDISTPTRTEIIVNSWEQNLRPICALHSGMFVFEKSRTVGVQKVGPRSTGVREILLHEYIKNRKQLFFAPTCAYSAELINDFPQMIGGSIIEDGVMNFRTVLRGKFIGINSPLVYVRTENPSGGRGYCIREPIRWNRFIHSKIVSIRTCISDISHIKNSRPDKYDQYISIEKEYLKLASQLGKYFLPETKFLSLPSRLMFGVRLFFFPGAQTLLERAGRIYGFFELNKYKVFERLKRFALRWI